MKFTINTYQHFYFECPNFQEIWKSLSLKILTFTKKCHYFCTRVYHDRMRGAMLFCLGVKFCSSKQNLKLYESLNDKQHKYEQSEKNHEAEPGRYRTFNSQTFRPFFNDCIHCALHCYNTADPDDLATQRTRSSSAIVLSNITWKILISTQEILILWAKWLVKRISLSFTKDDPLHIISMTGLWNQSKYTKGAKTSNNHCGVIKSGRFGYKKISFLVLTCYQVSITETITF